VQDQSGQNSRRRKGDKIVITTPSLPRSAHASLDSVTSNDPVANPAEQKAGRADPGAQRSAARAAQNAARAAAALAPK